MTKLRLIAAAIGFILGLGGVFTLFVAVTLALAQSMGIVAASFVVAGLALGGGLVCLVFFVQPFRSIEEEVEEVEEATAGALAELPFDTMRTIIQRRPLTMATLALVMGYSMVRHPQAAQHQAARVLMSLL